MDARLPALLAADTPAVDPGDPLPFATREALLSPGKRVRPVLVVLAGELFGAARPRLVDAGCAIEMVHAASLVLDDLPSMDDATTRRGKPGAPHGPRRGHRDSRGRDAAHARVRRHRRGGASPSAGRPPFLGRARPRLAPRGRLRPRGLASGQSLDLRRPTRPPPRSTASRRSTRERRARSSSRRRSSARCSAARARRSSRPSARMRKQRRPRVPDRGRPPRGGPGSDRQAARAGRPRPTFARHVGAEGARSLVAELTQHAVESLAPFGRKADLLREFAVMLRDRTR